jgi:chromosome segregation ATPase
LAGKPLSTGRSNKEDSYIKEGRDSAYIEIELFGGPGKTNLIIKRKISRKGSGDPSSWILNNKKVTEQKVKEVIKGLNIQVDNLCQFLAQERVCMFTGLNPQTLLTETEKAINDSVLHEQHLQLIEWGQNEKKLDQSISSMENQLSDLVAQESRLEEQVGRIRMRQGLIDTLDILEKKKPWIQVSLQKEKVENAEQHWKDIKRRLDRKSQEFTPFLEVMKYACVQVECCSRF